MSWWEAGAFDGKAAKAAKALADYDSRFNKIDKWMIGATLAVSGTVVGLLFNIMVKGIRIAG